MSQQQDSESVPLGSGLSHGGSLAGSRRASAAAGNQGTAVERMKPGALRASGASGSSIACRLAALEQRTGHELELRGDEGGYFVFDWSVGDALGEGRTRDEALESAEENC